MRTTLALGTLIVLTGTAAFAMPIFQEGVLVATSEEVAHYSSTLDALGELPVRRASAIAIAPDGATWVLSGRRLRSFAASGALLSDTRLPTAGDDDDADDDSSDDEEEDDDSEKHVALTVSSDTVAVALDRDLFLLSGAGDVTAELALPHHAVAAGVHGTRFWVAHQKGVSGFEGASASPTSRSVLARA